MTQIYDSATVQVTDPVDGRPRRRSRGRTKPKNLTYHIVVHPMVMAAAKQAQRPGEHLVIISEDEVWLEYD